MVVTPTFYNNYTQFSPFAEDILLSHKVIASGVPNRFGCRIPVKSNWNLSKFQQLLHNYHDIEIINWLKFGFPVSWDPSLTTLIPAKKNHMAAIGYPQHINAYLAKEIHLGATMGPFTLPPFVSRIGISPLSSHEKRGSQDRRIIMDLKFPNR